MDKKVSSVTNEEVFNRLSENRFLPELRTFCKLRKEECQFIYDNSTYASEEVLYDMEFWKEKEEKLANQIMNESIKVINYGRKVY